MKRFWIWIVWAVLWIAAPAVIVGCDKDKDIVENEQGNGGDDNGGSQGGGQGSDQGGDNPGGEGGEGGDQGGENPGGDNPGGENGDEGGDTPGGGDNPGGDNPVSPTVVVLDPGKSPSEQTFTPQHPELEHNVSYDEFYSNLQDDLDEFGNVDYVCAQGDGTSWPLITSDWHIRLYQGSNASKGGSYIRIRSHNGATLQKVTVGTATPTSIAWYFDRRPSTKSATETMDAGSRKTLECPAGCTEVCFICMGTTQQQRWELDHMAVQYKGGFVDSDFFVPAAEYGPLVKVSMPLHEGFESGFPTTDKPSYYKYGLTAGRENLMWSTWYGSFSWQKAITGGQSAQLRVYQEEQNYDKSQFGHLKMEYFIKDLRKVSFKYYYSEFWNRATISYCEFGTTEYKNPVQIGLKSYSERQTVRDFTYILDEGAPHDAKIIIEIDPVTGHPSKDHYDFYFDDFVFE